MKFSWDRIRSDAFLIVLISLIIRGNVAIFEESRQYARLIFDKRIFPMYSHNAHCRYFEPLKKRVAGIRRLPYLTDKDKRILDNMMEKVLLQYHLLPVLLEERRRPNASEQYALLNFLSKEKTKRALKLLNAEPIVVVKNFILVKRKQ